VRLLEFQLKEKEQELKLCELKIKELKKSMPNSKLRPLQKRLNTSVDGNSIDFGTSSIGAANMQI